MRRAGVAAEAAFALLIGLLLAVVVRRPQDLSSTVSGDAGDPVLVAWILAWTGHAVRSGQELFDANAFAPLENTLAFSDPLLGYLPFSLVGQGPGAALARYDVVLLFTYARAFAGTWLLVVRQLGLGRAAALVAATAFAFNPWRAAMATHLQVLSSGGIPLVLTMLARGHGVRLRTAAAGVPARRLRARRRHAGPAATEAHRVGCSSWTGWGSCCSWASAA